MATDERAVADRRAAGDESQHGRPAGRTTRGGLARTVRVLVADDNRDAAGSLSLLLDVLGFDTRTAYDGDQAWGAALTFRPDACVLDIDMPRADGREVARRVRAAFGRRVLVVALTGRPPDDWRAAGFDALCVKPCVPDALVHLLAQAGSTPA